MATRKTTAKTRTRQRKNGAVKKPRARSSNVPGSYRGFTLQATRLLHYLLSSNPSDHVCLELFEDVGVEATDGSRIAEQDKSYTSKNPLSNRAPEFWKTFRNWVGLVASGELNPNATTFVIHAPAAKPGAVAEKFHKASSISEALIAIADAKASLIPNSATSNDANADMRDVLDCNVTQLAQVIIRFQIDAPSTHENDWLRELMLSKMVSEEFCDDALQWAHGWIKKRVDGLLSANEPVRIRQSEFHDALRSFVRAHDRDDILRSVAGEPHRHEIDNELTFRMYVRQLRLIELEDVAVLGAVNDFLRASIDRTYWSQGGFINEVSLTRFAQELETTWRNKQRSTLIINKAQPEHLQGQLLYGECQGHNAQLDGQQTPAHFVRGSFHSLADDRVIGWHPQYASRLSDAPSQFGSES